MADRYDGGGGDGEDFNLLISILCNISLYTIPIILSFPFTLSTWRHKPWYVDKGKSKWDTEHFGWSWILNVPSLPQSDLLSDRPGDRPRKSLEEACCSYLINEKERIEKTRGGGECLPFRSFPKEPQWGGRSETGKKEGEKMKRLWKTATSHRLQQHAWLTLSPSASHLSEVWALGWAGTRSQPRKERKSEDIFNRLLSALTL